MVQNNLNDLKEQIEHLWDRLIANELIGLETENIPNYNFNIIRDNRETYNQESIMNSTQYGGQMESNRFKNKAQHIIEEDIIGPAQQYLTKAREYGSEAVEKGADVVRQNPGYSVLGAAAIGFLAGAYFFRRK